MAISLGDLGELLARLRPFREIREERDEIKTAYRKNILNIDTGEPVENFAGYDTHHLGDKIEDMHIETKKIFRNKGKEHQKYHSTRRRGRDKIEYYNIPEEEAETVKEQMNDVITAIERKNRISKLKEYSLYVVVFILLLYLLSLSEFPPVSLV